MQGVFLFRFQQDDAAQFGCEQVQFFIFGARQFVYADGDVAVYAGSGDLLEYRGAVVGIGSQKGVEPALCQQHGACEPVEVHAGEAFDCAAGALNAGFDDFAGIGVGDFMSGLLEIAVAFLICAAVAPVAAVVSGRRFECDFGKAFSGLA